MRTTKKTHTRYRIVDLFAGIGGIRTGFDNTGHFETVYANDFDKYCKITYDANSPKVKLDTADIQQIALNAELLPDFDFLLAGFPCQPFSVAGYRKGFEDEKGRGNLFFDIIKILDKKKPLGFLLENVKNLKGHDNGNTFKVIYESLNALGYDVTSNVLNTKDYGNVPQNRERIYIVGFKKATGYIKKFKFPDPVPLLRKIADLLDHYVDEKYFYNEKPLYNKLVNSVMVEGKIYQWRRKYVRENKNDVCPTLTANMGMGGHNVPIIKQGNIIRKLSPRECLRFQGYPDNFILPPQLADSKLYKQIGNSVTVPVVEAIARMMLKAME